MEVRGFALRLSLKARLRIHEGGVGVVAGVILYLKALPEPASRACALQKAVSRQRRFL